jgi:hypothetical protein
MTPLLTVDSGGLQIWLPMFWSSWFFFNFYTVQIKASEFLIFCRLYKLSSGVQEPHSQVEPCKKNKLIKQP